MGCYIINLPSKVFCRYFLDFIYIHIHCIQGIRVEVYKLAAHEEVLHFCLYSIYRLLCLCGGIAIGSHFGLFPCGIVGEGSIECFYLFGRNALNAAAVGRSAAYLRYLFNELRKLFGRKFRNYAVTVECAFCKNFCIVGCILYGYCIFLEAEIAKNLFGGFLKSPAFGIICVERIQRHFRTAGQKLIRVFQERAYPFGSIYHFIYVDEPVAIGVDVFKGCGIEFEVLYGAAENGPHLAVKFVKMLYIFTAFNQHSY